MIIAREYTVTAEHVEKLDSDLRFLREMASNRSNAKQCREQYQFAYDVACKAVASLGIEFFNPLAGI